MCSPWGRGRLSCACFSMIIIPTHYTSWWPPIFLQAVAIICFVYNLKVIFWVPLTLVWTWEVTMTVTFGFSPECSCFISWIKQSVSLEGFEAPPPKKIIVKPSQSFSTCVPHQLEWHCKQEPSSQSTSFILSLSMLVSVRYSVGILLNICIRKAEEKYLGISKDLTAWNEHQIRGWGFSY